MTAKKRDPNAPLSIIDAPRRGRGPDAAPVLPKSPEVDEKALARAEEQIAAERGATLAGPVPTQKPAATPKGSRLRRLRTKPAKKEEAVIFITAPKPICDAFNDYKKANNFRSAWAALEALMLANGIEIEDFDA
jgi:hypothetical protein